MSQLHPRLDKREIKSRTDLPEPKAIFQPDVQSGSDKIPYQSKRSHPVSFRAEDGIQMVKLRVLNLPMHTQTKTRETIVYPISKYSCIRGTRGPLIPQWYSRIQVPSSGSDSKKYKGVQRSNLQVSIPFTSPQAEQMTSFRGCGTAKEIANGDMLYSHSRSPITPPADDHDPEKSSQIPPLHISGQLQVFLIRQVSGISLDWTRWSVIGFLFLSGRIWC
jgi:hypothetical protein